MTDPGFRGARPLTDEDSEFFRRHRQAVNEAINRHNAARDALIRSEIKRLGHDPDSRLPIPDWIVESLTKRMALGEFDGPITVRITDKEEPRA